MNAVAVATPRSSWRSPDLLLLVAALASSLAAWWLIAAPVLSFDRVAKHIGHHALLYFHTAGGTVMLFLGAINLYVGATRKHFRYHRAIGRTYLVGGLFGVTAAVLIMLVARGHKDDGVLFTNTTISLLTLSFAWYAAALMAWRAVRNRRYDSHRDWMVRSYILIWAFVFCRLAARFEGVEEMGGGTAFIWLSWVGPLVVGEIALQWRAGSSQARVVAVDRTPR